MDAPEDFPLPEYAHIPGVNPRPDTGSLEKIAEAACKPTTDETAEANIAWKYGLRLLNEGFYWEAHEVLEQVWMNAPPNSRERHLVQGVIHIANAALKVQMDRPRATKRLSKLAEESLERAFSAGIRETLMGLDRNSLMKRARECGEAGN